MYFSQIEGELEKDSLAKATYQVKYKKRTKLKKLKKVKLISWTQSHLQCHKTAQIQRIYSNPKYSGPTRQASDLPEAFGPQRADHRHEQCRDRGH